MFAVNYFMRLDFANRPTNHLLFVIHLHSAAFVRCGKSISKC